MVEVQARSEVRVKSPTEATVPTTTVTTTATPDVIVQYLKKEELRCLEERVNSHNETNHCPCLPNNLREFQICLISHNYVGRMQNIQNYTGFHAILIL